MKPSLYVIGAPKCGTTSICDWLSQHPDVFMSSPKEPHFFSRIKYSWEQSKLSEEYDGYNAIFELADKEDLAAEGSTEYLFYAEEVVPRIERYNPGSKFVVCIRDPAEMALSLHAERVFQGEEDVHDFREAWKLESSRLKGEKIPNSAIDPNLSCYRSTCSLGSQLHKLFDLVPRERVHVIILDDIKSDPRKAFSDLMAFIGLSVTVGVEFNKRNSRKIRKSQVLNKVMIKLGWLKKSLGVSRSFGALSKIDRWNRREVVQTDKELDLDWVRRQMYREVELVSKYVGERVFDLWGYDIVDKE